MAADVVDRLWSFDNLLAAGRKYLNGITTSKRVRPGSMAITMVAGFARIQLPGDARVDRFHRHIVDLGFAETR